MTGDNPPATHNTGEYTRKVEMRERAPFLRGSGRADAKRKNGMDTEGLSGPTPIV